MRVLIETQHQEISIARQCELLGLGISTDALAPNDLRMQKRRHSPHSKEFRDKFGVKNEPRSRWQTALVFRINHCIFTKLT